MRRAKIVATLGPATASYENIRAIIEAGVNVARMNLSHGSYEVHEEVYQNVRKAAADAGAPIAVLVDLQGPKIRLGKFENGPHELAVGDIFTITTEDVPGTKELVGTTFKGLPQDVKSGDFLLIDDGKVKVRVLDSDGVRVRTEVVVAGPVSNNKGINLPGVAVNVPALSEKDEADLRWGLALGADYIALSFVRNAADVTRVHEIMAEEGRKVPVIAKIEKPQAVDALEEIIDAFDGIMVARGDLGVELPLEAVPIVQKHAVELARRMAKPVIVATQMLESMISSPVPTRAETSDVANAVLDGADAVMLSGETSVGQYPAVTVATMARIVASTEEHGLERIPPLGTKPRTQGGAITLAAAEVAAFVEAKYVCVFTESGDSARRMSRLRFNIPMKAFTPDEAIRRRMSLTWGIESFLVERVTHTDAMYAQVDRILLDEGLAEIGDKVVVISGSPPGIPGSTNDLRVHVVGDAINKVAQSGKAAITPTESVAGAADRVHADGSAGDADYGRIGAGYARYRRPDARIAGRILDALGDAETVLNVGAGAGSYEPRDRRVTAVEPSASMRAQRPTELPEAVDATAESLPFDDDSFDASMATFTVHQWSSLSRGLAELRRVTRGPVVVLSCDPELVERFWLAEYAPRVLATEARRYPALGALADGLGGRIAIDGVSIPLDCTDGFGEAYYGRPELLLDAGARLANSAWSFVPDDVAAGYVARLESDIASGEWDRRYGELRSRPEFDGSLRLLVAR